MNEFENSANTARTLREDMLKRMLRIMATSLDALATGARSIPMGDNGALLKGLASRTGVARRGSRQPRCSA